MAGTAFTIQKALNIWKKGNKFPIVPLTKQPGVVRKLVIDTPPRMGISNAFQNLPVV
jgi:hypothetical protein